MKGTITSIITIIVIAVSLNLSAQVPNFNVTVNTGVTPGYFFLVPYQLPAFPTYPPGTQNQMVIDHNGHVVYYKPVAGHFAGDFKMHWNGLMSYADDNKFYFVDSTFTIVDSVTSQNGIDFDLHDIQILHNGHFLLLGNENVTMDLSSYHIFNGNGTAGSSSATVTAGVLQELDANKNVVFEWHSKDYFAFDDADEFFLTNPSAVDWTHMNSIELDTDSNLIISSRHFAEITKISRTDSSIIWRLGGKRNQFTFINDTIMFLAQHDARRLPNGHLLLFDNGRQNPLHPAIAKEYELDEVNMTATLVWSHMEGPNIFSRSQGNCQRLANGLTMISYGNPINENIVFNVVDSLNNKVFEVSFPDSQITYRTFYYDSVNFLFNRSNILCNGDSLSADSGFVSYAWSNGRSTQSIFVNTADTFFVYVPLGDSGFISSDFYIVTDSLNICGGVGITEVDKGGVVVYPNPANDQLYVRLQEQLPLDVFDITGRQVFHFTPEHTQISIDVSSLQPGVYFMRSGRHTVSFVKS